MCARIPGENLVINVKSVKLDTRVLDAYIKELGGNADNALAAIALDVQALAAHRAPRDTGALKASIKARRVTFGKLWRVEDGVEYGIYQELGTHKMAAQPFMIPGVEMAAKRLVERFKRVFGK